MASERQRQRLVFVPLLIGIGVLLLAFLIVPVSNPIPAGIGNLGRFHPLLVHFPVVLILLPLLVEGWMLWRKVPRPLGFLEMIWWLAGISSLGAWMVGMLLYGTGEYSGDLVSEHLWRGTWLVVLVMACWSMFLWFRKKETLPGKRGYLALLMLANIMLINAAHLGGSLTHGEDYLAALMPAWGEEVAPVEQKPREELMIYHDLIQPVLDIKCAQCHNENKTKGGLNMVSLENVLEGGKSEKPMIVAGKPVESEWIHRITLPADHDDHMPPEGKPALSDQEAHLMKWWIEKGADPEVRVASFETDSFMQVFLPKFLPGLAKVQRDRIREKERQQELFEELQELAEDLGVVIEPDPDMDSAYFAVSMKIPPERVNNETLQKLMPYAAEFSKLSLVSSEITDDGLYFVSKMENLRKLFLQKTCIEGSGLTYLTDMPHLELISLSHTNVNDLALLSLMAISSLKTVYLHDTKVGQNMIEAFNRYKNGKEVLPQVGPFY